MSDLTAPGADTFERCIAAGANDYVPKPVETIELVAAIGPWLPRHAPAAA